MLYSTILLAIVISDFGISRSFFLPRPGPSSGTETEKQNGTDAIVIEHTGNGTIPPFIPRPFPIIPPKTCPKERSCLARCTQTRQVENIAGNGTSLRCFCDPECNTVFHDCCADYARYCKETGNQSNVMEWECVKIAGQVFGIWMINKCAQHWPHDQLRSECESTSAEIGLKDLTLIVDEFSNTFRNRHCARCNNVEKFTCLRLGMRNSTSQNISATRRSRFFLEDIRRNVVDECPGITSRNHSIGLRYCYNTRSSCKDVHDSTEAARNCRDGKAGLVSFKNETYKNFYCLKCNHPYSFGFFPPKVSCGPYLSSGSRINFAAIFRLPDALPTDTSRCSSGFFYDATARACRKLLKISDLNSNHSSFLTKYAIRLHYKRNQKPSCFSFSAYNTNRTKENEEVILRQLSKGFNDEFFRRIRSNSRDTNWTLSDVVIYIESTSYTSVMFHILAVKSEINETKLFSLVKDLKLGRLSFLYDYSNASSVCSYSLNSTSSRRMNCLNQNQSSVAVRMNKVSIFDNGTLFHQDTRDNFKAGEYLLYKNHNQTRLALCEKTTPTNCKFILKSESNWKVFLNGSIYSNITNTWFEYGEYSIMDGVAWLCLTDELPSKSAKEKRSRTIHETILRYSTLVCFSISILGLVLLLFVYAIIPTLRNLPGKNLMLLCSVLALAQFLWLLQEQAFQFRNLCLALAILLHFLFLASFSCATSIAVLSFSTFRGIANGRLAQSNDERPFLWYALFSLGAPCVWLTLFILLDYHGIFMLDYGSVKGHCWLGNTRGMYVSVLAPVFTLLCVNLALLLATVNMIRKCSQTSKKFAKSKQASVNRNHIWIYIRMASLMGFTWLLGVFQIVFPKLVVFDYLFVFVNGLQGFYIALAFLCTDNVKRILSRRISIVSGKSSSLSK